MVSNSSEEAALLSELTTYYRQTRAQYRTLEPGSYAKGERDFCDKVIIVRHGPFYLAGRQILPGTTASHPVFDRAYAAAGEPLRAVVLSVEPVTPA